MKWFYILFLSLLRTALVKASSGGDSWIEIKPVIAP